MKKEKVVLYMRTNNFRRGYDNIAGMRQKKELELYCKEKNYNIKDAYYDIGSCKYKDKLPAYNKMINDIKKGKVKKVIIVKLDRISRDISDLEKFFKMLKEYNCVAEFIREDITTSGLIGKLFTEMLPVFSVFEKELIEERKNV